jgi:ABC-2 type transport system permease protein
MSLARASVIFFHELSHTFRRPLFWFLVALLFVMSWGFSNGSFEIESGDTTVGGTRPWVTSEFSFAMVLGPMMAMFYGFFGSIASGMTIISDDEARITDMLLATPLRPSEYVWGKFLAILGAFLGALGLHLLLAFFFYHVVPDAEAAEIRGPFDLVNYLRPALVFALPTLVFYLGVAFYLGERWRRPITVFLFPTALLLLSSFFLWRWAPTWLDPKINHLLMLVDASGFRWLNETWLKLDRGAEFYNTTRIGLDAPFVISRLVFLGIGLLGVLLAQRHLAEHLQGETGSSFRLLRRRQAASLETRGAVVFPRPLTGLGMAGRGVGLIRGVATVAGTELENLFASPGLYLFGVLIVILSITDSLLSLGAFQTEMLLTPGVLAEQSMEILGVMTCLLLMFYTAESIERERVTGLAAISSATPVRTASFLFGKALANCGAGLVLAAATFLGCVLALLIKGEVGLDLRPFLLLWGGLMVPTFLVWICFILAVQAMSGQRYVTYGAGLGAIAVTTYFKNQGTMSWVGNWWLVDSILWSDMGTFDLDGRALLLNRLLYLGLAVLFTAIAVRAFGRREADALGLLHRRQPPRLWRGALRLAPYAVVPLVIGCALWLAVDAGFQGGEIEKKERDYWTQNLATWREAPQPAIAGVDVDLEIEPAERWLSSRGSYELVNDRKEPLPRFALTGGPHWEKLRWTFNGKETEPENRSGLYVFTPPAPLQPGGRVRVGWEFEGRFPKGVSKNGGGASQFILPSGVVLTDFRPSFAPVVGYVEGVGVKEGENDYEPRDYEEGFHEGRTAARFGSGRPFPTRISITGPSEYTFNAVGARVSETEKDGQRTVVWKSDHPVRLFNVVGGRWDVRRGRGTAVYYHPGHPYNVDAMLATLDAARRHYSEWFHPFPWREIRISEFPNWAGYAQGFPTNIPFSEGIGFLTRSDEKTDAVFLVTAHETAHQWWANLLTPGEGPGGSLLSEGMAHYSTALLFEKVKGPNARMEFLKRLEESYGNERRPDAERPVVQIDDSRPGDRTVTYDKGAWVFWMMDRHLGRERMLAGLRKFIADWGNGPDYPVLQDFTAALRPFAADPAAYDAFVKQWFHEVVVSEYRLSDARLVRAGEDWKVIFEVKNAGTSRMPVELAAVRGERFDDKGKPRPGYKDARTRVVLGPGEARRVEILCAFEPERVVADPDVQVLQLRRKGAVVGL